MPSSRVIVQLKDVKKSYPLGNTRVNALSGVSFEIKEGEFATLVGASGSGKSTLLNIIGCIDQLDSGSFFLGEKDVSRLPDDDLSDIRNSQIGFVFQSFNLVPVLSVYENIELPLLINRSVPASERNERVLSSLRDVGILDKKDNLPDQLSGGQRQRVAIARALAAHPILILADEPTANLDSETSEKILDLFVELNKKRGVTVLMSSHDDRVIKRAERVLRISDGHLVNT